MSVVVGIDLGTTNSLVSFWDGTQAQLIPNAHGQYLTPSVVGFDENDQLLVGEIARNRLVTHPGKTVSLFKRYMGSERQYDLGQPGRRYRPEELSSFVLRSLKADAEAFLGQPITEAVISVPAYFNDKQRKATRAAGQLAGLKVERLINEPTAAALSYGLHCSKPDSSFLVFDLGGGTFDVSVLSLFEGIMEVNATVGNNRLGGEDFLNALVDAFLHEKMPGQLHPQELSQLRWQMQQAKVSLSSQRFADIELTLNGQNYHWEIDRDRFESLCTGLMDQLKQPIERALADAYISPNDLDAVILAGGASRMPMIRSLAARLFGQFPRSHLDPDHIVALGAAVQAGLKQRSAGLKEVVLTDVTPFTLGIATARRHPDGQYSSGHYAPIIERNTVVPVSRTQSFSPLSAGQEQALIRVFQGESRHVCNNVPLGELQFALDSSMGTDPAFDVRFSYDINGILEVTATNASGQSDSLVIMNSDNTLSEEEILKRLSELAKLKIHPRDQQQNRLLLARGERLYEQSRGDTREWIADMLTRFETTLESQDPQEIAAALDAINSALDHIERGTP